MDYKPFNGIATNYKAIIFDAYGVLKNQNGLIKGIDKTLAFLEQKNIAYYILTNDACQSPALLAQFYQKEGITSVHKESIISSANLAGEFLREQLPQGAKVVYMGSEESAFYIKSVGMHAIPISQYQISKAGNMDAFIILDDKGVDLNLELNKVVNLIRKYEVPLILANPDKIYPTSESEVSIAAGGIAACLEEITGKQFIKFGKPDMSIFQYAMQRIAKQISIQKNQILMVGDTLETDIAGGNNFGIDTTLVLTGNTRREELGNLISQTNIIPTFVCDSVLIPSANYKI